MARVVPVWTNFTAGEFSPRLLGREDIQRYGSAAAELDNFRPFRHGGITRRPGLKYVAEVKDSSKAVRLIDFEHDADTAYILEMGDQYMRVYRDNGQVQSGGSPYEVATDFLEAELFDLQYVQSADIMYFADQRHWPRKLSRTGDTSWTIAQVAFVDGPYIDQDISDPTLAITMTPSGTTGSITITASAAFFDSDMAPVGTEPGAYIRMKHGATWGYAQITGFTSSTQVTATVKSTLGGTSAATEWNEGAWSTYRGFPRALAFYEERLYFGGTSFQPQTLWGSAVGAYEDHTPGVANDDAVNYTIASRRQNTIQWMASNKFLFLGTTGKVYAAGDPNLPLTPSNVRILPENAYASALMQPVEVSNALLYVSRSRRKLRELSFDFRDDAYRAPDQTVLAEHITQGGLTQLAFAEEPEEVIYATRVKRDHEHADGAALACTFDREQEIVAWSTITTNGTIESMAVIPATSGTEGYSQVWALVNRTIGGATKRYVEYFAEDFDDSAINIEDAFFVDSGLTYDGAATTTLSGLDHLEGETVQILGNGGVIPDQTVSGGSITLPVSVTKASVGLAYTSRCRTLPVVTGNPSGSAQGVAKSWGRVKMRLFETVGLEVNGKELILRRPSNPMDTALPLFTGIKEAQVRGWDDEGQITFTQSKPLPTTILSIFGTCVVEDQ